ncbi:hypothetical protein KKG66_06855, partial [bacterium]|nr:hypothetical protein [bacterium]
MNFLILASSLCLVFSLFLPFYKLSIKSQDISTVFGYEVWFFWIVLLTAIIAVTFSFHPRLRSKRNSVPIPTIMGFVSVGSFLVALLSILGIRENLLSQLPTDIRMFALKNDALSLTDMVGSGLYCMLFGSLMLIIFGFAYLVEKSSVALQRIDFIKGREIPL